jgi:hypothetical protein
MSLFRITPAHDESVQIEFEVPIKGRQNPLFFTVPKVQYLPQDVAAEYEQWFKDREGQTTKDHEATLKLLELTVPKHYATLSKLTIGELTQISQVWGEQSTIEAGESSASDDS